MHRAALTGGVFLGYPEDAAARRKARGCSIGGKWPSAFTCCSDAPPSKRQFFCPAASGALRTSAPTTTRVGHVIAEISLSKSRAEIMSHIDPWKLGCCESKEVVARSRTSGRRPLNSGGNQRALESWAMVSIPCVRATLARSRNASPTGSLNVHRVATSVRDRTSSGWLSAKRCATIPPTDMPTRCAAPTLACASTARKASDSRSKVGAPLALL